MFLRVAGKLADNSPKVLCIAVRLSDKSILAFTKTGAGARFNFVNPMMFHQEQAFGARWESADKQVHRSFLRRRVEFLRYLYNS